MILVLLELSTKPKRQHLQIMLLLDGIEHLKYFYIQLLTLLLLICLLWDALLLNYSQDNLYFLEETRMINCIDYALFSANRLHHGNKAIVWQ